MNKLVAILAALALAGCLFAQTNRNAHRADQKGWTSPDAVAAAQRIEFHAKDLGLTHSQLITIHGINQRLHSQPANPNPAPPPSKTKRIVIGTPMDAGTQALQQIQRVLNMHQREKVVQSGWLNG